jgi:hypothetical protein
MLVRRASAWVSGRQLGLLRDQAAGPEQQGQQQRKPARH